jgi:hypothetical protein
MARIATNEKRTTRESFHHQASAPTASGEPSGQMGRRSFGANLQSRKPGKITMPLQDTSWGAYFGSVTDKYGVQWMVNCTEAKS